MASSNHPASDTMESDMRVFSTLDEVAAATGEELGTSEWLTIDQDRVNKFADATGDHQWIHVDVERAARGRSGHGSPRLPHALAGPAAGNTVFSLETPKRQAELRREQGALPEPGPRRLPHPLDDQRRRRGRPPTGKQLTLQHVIEIEGEVKPACVAESVVLLLP